MVLVFAAPIYRKPQRVYPEGTRRATFYSAATDKPFVHKALDSLTKVAPKKRETGCHKSQDPVMRTATLT